MVLKTVFLIQCGISHMFTFILTILAWLKKSGSIRVINATPYSALDFMFNEKLKTLK